MHREEQESYLLGDGTSTSSVASDDEHEKPGSRKTNALSIYVTFLGTRPEKILILLPNLGNLDELTE